MSDQTRPHRNDQIDFWRGLALIMIFIDHMPENPLAHMTLKVLGFADAAEIFVFLAGATASLTIGRAFERSGIALGLIYNFKRVWRLFRAHIMLFVGISAVIAMGGLFTDSAPIKEQFNFLPFFLETDQSILRLVRLAYMPSMMDILPLYIVLLSVFPLIWLLYKHAPAFLVAVTFGGWYLASSYGMGPNEYPDNMIWHFNPLAWQFLFVCGIVMYSNRKDLLERFGGRVSAGFAVLFVIFSFVAVAPWIVTPDYEYLRIVPGWVLSYDNKTDLSLIRLVHFMCLCLLACKAWPWLSRKLPNKVKRPLCLMGKHSLLVFCASAVLSMGLYIAYKLFELGPFAYVLLNVCGLVTMYTVASWAETIRKLERRQMPGETATAAETL